MSAGKDAPDARGATEGERLQKVIARAGVASRRAAEELIREGRVTVNGRVAELGERVDPGRDTVKVDGRAVRPRVEHRYLLLNKPVGFVTTLSDPEGRDTVLDLIPHGLRRALFPVGRLDYHTEGLLLLTTDGELAQAVSHPRQGCVKTYEVKVKGEPGEELLDRLRAGVVVAGRRTAPARIRRRPGVVARGGRRSTANSWWMVELAEGRTRQIREMFRRVGHPVQRLRRVAIGPLRDAKLAPGSYRPLTDEEVEALRRASSAGSGPDGRPARRRKPATKGRRTSR
ncbi:MAG TPA: pseudouridine synthase [Thermoanaerobaculia bacterium]|nr:pseudouridine synthase [Thermoanaerobaculia bacterium]